MLKYPAHRNCGDYKFCAIYLTTTLGMMINLSITDIKYKGQNNTSTCSFGGLAAFDAGTEISTVCLKPNHILETTTFGENNYVFPNIYSKGNHMHLFLYFYKEYGHIYFELNLSTTHCRSILVNTCEGKDRKPIYDLFLTQVRKYNLEVKDEECFILQLRYGAQDLEDNQHHHGISSTKRLPRMLGKKPFVKNFNFMYQKSPVERCQMEIHPETKSQKGHKIQMDITAFFRGLTVALQKSSVPSFCSFL